MFQLKIKLDDAAFDDSLGGELARILRRLADDLDGDPIFRDEYHAGRLRDINGNVVGDWELDEEVES